MKITRLTKPQFTAVSKAELEAWLRIDAGQDDLAINLLVGSATEYVEGITGLCLGLSSYRVELDGGRYSYRLPFSPVGTITKVETRDVDGTLHEVTGWHLAGDCLHLIARPARPLVITLSAGYPDVASVPLALCHAIAILVSAGFNGREDLSDQTIKTVDRLCQRHKRIAW